MKISENTHLAYCTNVHRGNSWPETLNPWKSMSWKSAIVAPERRFAIGLRLGADTARQLMEGQTLAKFRLWLEQNNAYVFTINGFPYGNFHGSR